MSIQSISFGATTKKGNNYKKTHAGVITGSVVGASLAANGIKNAKTMKMPIYLLRILGEQKQSAIQNGFTANEAKSLIKKSLKTGMAANIITTALFCIALGTGIDAYINNKRAKKADKLA